MTLKLTLLDFQKLFQPQALRLKERFSYDYLPSLSVMKIQCSQEFVEDQGWQEDRVILPESNHIGRNVAEEIKRLSEEEGGSNEEIALLYDLPLSVVYNAVKGHTYGRRIHEAT